MGFVNWKESLLKIQGTFRKSFDFPNKNVTQWFPGHMAKGLKQMESRLKRVDCLVEVHDARIPFSGRNPKLWQSFAAVKPHVLVLNKSDLVPQDRFEEIKTILKEKQNINDVIFTNAKSEKCSGLKAIVPKVVDLVKQSERFNRSEAEDFNILVMGVPNVGKSSLINALRAKNLRKRKAAPEGAVAGITRSVQERIKVCENPLVYLLDTPGIMDPRVDNVETGFKLAICATLKDHLVGEEHIADYLLYWLNKNSEFGYVDSLELYAPTDSIQEVLVHIAARTNLTMTVRHYDGSLKTVPNLNEAAKTFIRFFRQKKFGPVILDTDLFR